MLREVAKLPPQLREQFQTPAGHREFLRTVVDKRLLFEEAKRRGLTQREDLARQVRELEERLAIQALLSEEESKSAAPTEEELSAFYTAHAEDFRVPTRVRCSRILVKVDPAKPEEAKKRAQSLRARLLKGEPASKVVVEGDGPERLAGGDVGWLTPAPGPEIQASLLLTRPGEVTPIVETVQGLQMLILAEREESRLPPFPEVRGAVLGRMQPSRQRKVFDALVTRLRSGAKVEYGVSTAAR